MTLLILKVTIITYLLYRGITMRRQKHGGFDFVSFMLSMNILIVS